MKYLICVNLLLLVGILSVFAESWAPYEASLILFNETKITHHYRFNLTSPFVNQHQDLTIKCEGDCDYIPRIFQCTGSLTHPTCRIETHVGYELFLFYLQSESDGLQFYYYLLKNPLITSSNCDADYVNWVEDTSLRIYYFGVVATFIGCIIIGLGYLRKPVFEYTIAGIGLSSQILIFAGICHMGQSCMIYQT